MNKEKSHQQITDNIYEREGHRYEDMYQSYLVAKIAHDNKTKNFSSLDI